MARKAVNGYPEKSFYDNTTFTGIVATGDPLNEGSFALITNFNITDSGKSLVPRDGYLSTTFRVDNEDVILSDKVLIFRDPNIRKDIIIDFAKADILEDDPEKLKPFAYLVDITPYNIDANKNKIFKGKTILNYDTKDLVSFIKSFGNHPSTASLKHINAKDILERITVLGQPQLMPVRDKDGVVGYITKLRFHYNKTIPPRPGQDIEDKKAHIDFWIKIYYRENGNTERHPSLVQDTLIISIVDTTQQTVRLLPRNIASHKSIITNPPRTQEERNTQNTEVVRVNSTMLMQARTKIETEEGIEIESDYVTTLIDEKYRNNLDIRLIPMFHLQDPDRVLGKEGAKWAYRFVITSTADVASVDITTSVAEGGSFYSKYKTPWRTLPVSNTTQGQNPIIEELNLIGKDIDAFEDEYIFFVVPDIKNPSRVESRYLGSGGITEDFLALGEAETYERMLYSAMRTFSNESLGRLSDAYTLTKTLESVVPDDGVLEAWDSSFFDSTNYKFVSSEEMIKAMDPILTPQAKDVNITSQFFRDCVERKVSFVAGDFTTPDGAIDEEGNGTFSNEYTADTTIIDAPNIIVDAIKYNAITKNTYREFAEKAKEISKTKKVRVVFLPFIAAKAQENAQARGPEFEPFVYVVDRAYSFCSAGGIYASGLKEVNNSTISTGPIATWEQIKELKSSKTFTMNTARPYKYVDVFNDLDNLYIKDLLEVVPSTVFHRGIVVTMYLTPYTDAMLNKTKDMTNLEINALNTSWEIASFKQTAQAFWGESRDVVYLNEYDDENPQAINDSSQYTVFEDRLVVWYGNRVYISEEGDYFFFTEQMKKTFPEEVLKVIAFKGVPLVFTTQNLYAIYRIENEVVNKAKDEEGKDIETTTKEIIWLQQPVLYNINPDRRYLDVIQVYNQMVLFYSSEGQLYMIKPSSTIDSETQFGIQYFNKSANHIFAHYEEYINERLKAYNKLNVNDPEDYVTKEQVKIKALLDIDTIKIFFSVPNRITFVVVYDVVNNRYTTYDTLSFTQAESLWHVEGGEAYLTREGTHTYITVPIQSKLGTDQNADMHYQNVFKKEPIFTLLDTGVLNLNNHITKRMRDLRLTIKNIDATKILYNAELTLDDTIIRPMYSPNFRVKMVNGLDTTMRVEETPQADVDELFGLNQTIGIDGTREEISSFYLHQDKDFFEKNALLRTETINSTRLIEYNSSILGVGKNIRLRIQLVSKGKYKLQSFSIIYKEKHA